MFHHFRQQLLASSYLIAVQSVLQREIFYLQTFVTCDDPGLDIWTEFAEFIHFCAIPKGDIKLSFLGMNFN
jgi:hypothetical protein